MPQPIPPIGYGVDVQKTLASIIGVDAQPYDVIRLNVAARFPVDWTNEQVIIQSIN